MSSVGIAGSSPFGLPSSSYNVLLMNAVQARWDTDVTAPPAAADILFLPTWYTSSRDIEMIFRHTDETRPLLRRSTDQRYQGVDTMVDVHVFVRSAGGDTEPTDLNKVVNGIKTIIHKNKSTLIANSNCVITAILPGRLEAEDDRQTLWHRIVRVMISNYQVSIV